jgi:hypothetical protein
MMAGQTSAFAMPSVVLSVANLAEGPKYIQNVTYQYTNEPYQQPVQKYDLGTLRFGFKSSHSAGDLGNVNANIVNNGEKDLIVTGIEIYRGSNLFASINGQFIVNAHSEGSINFQVYNLKDLSKSEVQWLTGRQITNTEASLEWVQYWRPVLYNAVLKTSEGVMATDYHFTFPTAPGVGTV